MDQLKFVTPEQAREIAEKVFEKSVQKKSEEGFEKIESKIPLIYDLEKRIKEINNSSEAAIIPLEKIERLVYEVGVSQAEQMLKNMYPNGYKAVIYSDEDQASWSRGERAKLPLVREYGPKLVREEKKEFVEAVRKGTRD